MKCDYVIMPAAEPDVQPHWLRVVDGQIVQRGRGPNWRHPAEEAENDDVEGRVLLVLPPHVTTLHWIACPGMTLRQGAAAARLMALEASIGATGQLHASALESGAAEEPHIVAVASDSAMAHWVDWCEDHGVPRASLVPAPLLLPVPDDGFVRGRVGPTDVVRGRDTAFDGNEPAAPLILGDAPVNQLQLGDVESSLISALYAPPLDLRQGAFARSKARLFEADRLRRLGALLGLIIIVALLVTVVKIVKLNLEASSLDDKTVTLAKGVDPSISDAAEAQQKITARLAMRGGSGGFTGVMAGLMSAMRSSPTVVLTSVNQGADGAFRVQLAGARAEDINEVLITLQEAGWRISANAVQQQGGRLVADIMVVC
jgi:general secretion pathway protein L